MSPSAPAPVAALLVPLSTRLGRRQRFAATRAAIGDGLRGSVERIGAPRALPCEDWPREEAGAPAVVRGWHASWSDTTGLVAALVAPVAVALDVEWLHRPRWQAARERFRVSGELARLADDGREAVLALWTAKEALLKLARRGLADLAHCPLVGHALEHSNDDFIRRFELRHEGRVHAVSVHRLDAHLVAVASAGPVELGWHVLQEAW